MRWLLGLMIAIPLPIVAFMFVAGGADGKQSSALKMALTTGPVIVCAAYALYRLVKADQLRLLDWAAILIALAPLWFSIFVVVRAINEPSVYEQMRNRK